MKTVQLFTEKRQSIYLACEEMNFVWDERDIQEFDRMWVEGLSLEDIARAFNRDPDEVVILVLDRARRGFIEPRKGGVNGRRMPRGTDREV